MLKKLLFITVLVLITACSSEPDSEHPLWSTSSYATEINDTQVALSLHFLDGVEDILQANVMIRRKDGSGALFEVQNAAVKRDKEILHFEWIDGFENKGTAKLSVLEKDEQTIRLHLKADEIANERNMMFIDDYVLRKSQPGPVENKSPTTGDKNENKAGHENE